MSIKPTPFHSLGSILGQTVCNRPMLAFLTWVTVSTFATKSSADTLVGGSIHVRVRGGTEIRAAAYVTEDQLTLRGELVDDAGNPVSRATVVVQAQAPDGGVIESRGLSLGPCEDGEKGAGRTRTNQGGATLKTDERGTFCGVGRAHDSQIRIQVRYVASEVYDGTELLVPVEGEQDHRLLTVLRFEPPPETIELDRDAITITASLRVDRSDALRRGIAHPTQRAGLALALDDERLSRLAVVPTSGDGRARFEIATASLAGPGRGELAVLFSGTAVLGKSVVSQRVVRRAEARVALLHPIDNSDPSEGLPIDVEVTTIRGPVSGGVVEVRRALPSGSESVGTSAVDAAGRARVVAVFPMETSKSAALALHYVPVAEWYRAGPDLRVEIKPPRPRLLRQLILAAAVVAAAAWVVGGWRRAPRERAAPMLDPGTSVPGRAGVHVIGSLSGEAGWRGTVTDAHEGTPVADAQVFVVAPGFAGQGVLARATSDEAGGFFLEGQHQNDARLVVESRAHSRHEQALPPPSLLSVTIVTRRRAVLDRLVRWARQRGAPFDSTTDATPGHVRRVAARASAQEIEAWAHRVESAAYGPETPDEVIERGIRAAEPGRRPAQP